jgi:simple sugar transport system permease protein
MNAEVILAAGIATGTILLFATIGEILTERSGVINLGVEGMMFVGALAGFKVGLDAGPWLGLMAAMAAGALLALLHAIVCIRFQADQIVSGLALTFLGMGVALVLGDGLAGTAATSASVPTITLPLLSDIPFLGPVMFTDQSALVYIGYLLVPVTALWISRTRPGLHLRAVGEAPSGADALGIDVAGVRYRYTCLGGALAGLAGATISLAVTPGWYAGQTTSGLGWIAVGLVNFARWDPWRAIVGAYLIAVIRRLTLDLQGPPDLFGIPNPFFTYQPSTFFLNMLPYAMVILVLVLGSRSARRTGGGAPAALGMPFVRGERGR